MVKSVVIASGCCSYGLTAISGGKRDHAHGLKTEFCVHRTHLGCHHAQAMEPSPCAWPSRTPCAWSLLLGQFLGQQRIRAHQGLIRPTRHATALVWTFRSGFDVSKLVFKVRVRSSTPSLNSLDLFCVVYGDRLKFSWLTSSLFYSGCSFC